MTLFKSVIFINWSDATSPAAVMIRVPATKQLIVDVQ